MKAICSNRHRRCGFVFQHPSCIRLVLSVRLIFSLTLFFLLQNLSPSFTTLNSSPSIDFSSFLRPSSATVNESIFSVFLRSPLFSSHLAFLNSNSHSHPHCNSFPFSRFDSIRDGIPVDEFNSNFISLPVPIGESHSNFDYAHSDSRSSSSYFQPSFSISAAKTKWIAPSFSPYRYFSLHSSPLLYMQYHMFSWVPNVLQLLDDLFSMVMIPFVFNPHVSSGFFFPSVSASSATSSILSTRNVPFTPRYGAATCTVTYDAFPSGSNAGQYDAYLYVIGGTDGTTIYNDVWQMSVSNGVWTQLMAHGTGATGGFPPVHHAACAWYGGYLLLLGGATNLAGTTSTNVIYYADDAGGLLDFNDYQTSYVVPTSGKFYTCDLTPTCLYLPTSLNSWVGFTAASVNRGGAAGDGYLILAGGWTASTGVPVSTAYYTYHTSGSMTLGSLTASPGFTALTSTFARAGHSALMVSTYLYQTLGYTATGATGNDASVFGTSMSSQPTAFSSISTPNPNPMLGTRGGCLLYSKFATNYELIEFGGAVNGPASSLVLNSNIRSFTSTSVPFFNGPITTTNLSLTNTLPAYDGGCASLNAVATQIVSSNISREIQKNTVTFTSDTAESDPEIRISTLLRTHKAVGGTKAQEDQIECESCVHDHLD